MIVLSLTVVPFFYRAKVFTAYEYLGRRFDEKTRLLSAVLFLVLRGLSCSVIVAAPAVILSIVLGWNLALTVLAIGLPTAVGRREHQRLVPLAQRDWRRRGRAGGCRGERGDGWTKVLIPTPRPGAHSRLP